MPVHPLVLAELRRSKAEAEFKLARLESEYKSIPAGAKSTMSTLRLHRRIQELTRVWAAWDMIVKGAEQ